MDYKQKYIKYKDKYLKLKKQSGGLTNLPYFRVKTSPIHGVGLFAIRDIPKNFKLFNNIDEDGEFIDKHDITNIETRKILEDYYCAPKGKLFLPNELMSHWSHYLNHNNNENVTLNDDTGWYITNRFIKAGEELFENYKIICDDSSEEF
jgi:hypothetical protein